MNPERHERVLGRAILVMGIVVATFVALGLHIAADAPIQAWVGHQMQGRTLNHTGAVVGAMAFATAMIDMGAISLLQILVYPRLPGRGPLAKGLVFGFLLLAVRSRFPRMFIMNLLIGNPLFVVLVQESPPVVGSLASSVVLSFATAVASKRGAFQIAPHQGDQKSARLT